MDNQSHWSVWRSDYEVRGWVLACSGLGSSHRAQVVLDELMRFNPHGRRIAAIRHADNFPWAHVFDRDATPQKEECGVCRFSLPIRGLDMVCRRYPPTVPATMSTPCVTVFPQIGPADWCGEFSRKV